MGRSLKTDSHDRIGDEHEYGGRNHNHGVDLELIAHLAVLRLRSNNSRIGDEREVVAEISATYDDGGHHSYVSIHRVGQSGGYWNQSYYGSHTCSDGYGDKAGSQEESWQNHAGWQDAERQVDGCINGSHRLG